MKKAPMKNSEGSDIKGKTIIFSERYVSCRLLSSSTFILKRKYMHKRAIKTSVEYCLKIVENTIRGWFIEKINKLKILEIFFSK